MVHNSNGDRPDVDQQQVPAYNDMKACLNQVGKRIKAYYKSTYPEPPSKSVINDVMVKNMKGLRQKNILAYGWDNICTYCWIEFRKLCSVWKYSPSLRSFQKQPFGGVLKKRCSENMQQIYRRTPMPKCDFNEVTKQLYWNHTSAWMFSFKFTAYFQNTFS